MAPIWIGWFRADWEGAKWERLAEGDTFRETLAKLDAVTKGREGKQMILRGTTTPDKIQRTVNVGSRNPRKSARIFTAKDLSTVREWIDRLSRPELANRLGCTEKQLVNYITRLRRKGVLA